MEEVSGNREAEPMVTPALLTAPTSFKGRACHSGKLRWVQAWIQTSSWTCCTVQIRWRSPTTCRNEGCRRATRHIVGTVRQRRRTSLPPPLSLSLHIGHLASSFRELTLAWAEWYDARKADGHTAVDAVTVGRWWVGRDLQWSGGLCTEGPSWVIAASGGGDWWVHDERREAEGERKRSVAVEWSGKGTWMEEREKNKIIIVYHI